MYIRGENMFKTMKRAQTATEYLIILAVVIIVALIVVGVLGGIPGIGGGAKGRTSAAFWSTSDIAIVSAAPGTSYSLFNIRNNLRNSIDITALSLGGTSLTNPNTVPDLPITLTAGNSRVVNTTDVLCGAAGDSFSYAVSITYTDAATGASFTFDGDGIPVEGTCAN